MQIVVLESTLFKQIITKESLKIAVGVGGEWVGHIVLVLLKCVVNTDASGLLDVIAPRSVSVNTLRNAGGVHTAELFRTRMAGNLIYVHCADAGELGSALFAACRIVIDTLRGDALNGETEGGRNDRAGKQRCDNPKR